MALLPIAWEIDKDNGRGIKSRMRAIFDYPATRDLGSVYGTNFTLKLYIGEADKRNWKSGIQKEINIEIERFCNLSALIIQGSISFHQILTHKRMGLKSFKHSFKDGEKSFVFQMKLLRREQTLKRMFSDLILHGHICVDSASSEGAQADTDHSIEDSDAFCPVPEIHKSFSLLSNDFQHMFRDRCFSDVTLNCGGEMYSVHKSVLASRSPVFKAMFESDMKESRSDEILIDDVEPAALHVLLNYMYCGKIYDLSDAVACDLLYAADKYDLPVLKENCLSYLKTAVSLDNVCLILQSAVLQDENLKDIVFDYVFRHASTITKTKEWKALEQVQPHIYRDIFLSVSQNGLKGQKQDTVAQ